MSRAYRVFFASKAAVVVVKERREGRERGLEAQLS
tara:strand:+ start:689 stop:793 length:105 start_codon:yes stop_codon:yes gene_type:complete